MNTRMGLAPSSLPVHLMALTVADVVKILGTGNLIFFFFY